MRISCAVTQFISAFVFASQKVNPSSSNILNFKLLAFFCDCTGQFLSDLVGNPEDRFFLHRGSYRMLIFLISDD